MTPRRGPMSENEKAIFFVLLFPPLWPLGFAWLMCALIEAAGNGLRVLWHRIKLRFWRRGLVHAEETEMGEVWEQSLKSIRGDNMRKLHEVEKSLVSLKNKDGWYAEDHRKVIALRQEIAEVINRHSTP